MRASRFSGGSTVRTASGFLALLLLAVLASTGACFAEIVGRVPRVLILYPYDERIPATNIAGETARGRLLEATEGKIDLFSEFLDLSRFREKVHIDRMARYLAEKYVDHRPDVVIALGEESTSFIAANREHDRSRRKNRLRRFQCRDRRCIEPAR